MFSLSIQEYCLSVIQVSYKKINPKVINSVYGEYISDKDNYDSQKWYCNLEKK